MIATPVPAGLKKPVTPAVLPSNNDIQTTERPKANPPAATPPAVPQVVPKQAGYGLPCANCKTYYAADLKACPVCKAAERVSPSAAPVRSSMLTNEVCPDPIALEEERERFLREFKSQVFASQVPTSGNGSRAGRGMPGLLRPYAGTRGRTRSRAAHGFEGSGTDRVRRGVGRSLGFHQNL